MTTFDEPRAAVGPMRQREGLVIHEPESNDQPWVVELPEGRYVRVGAHAAQLLQAADGTSHPDVISRRLGRPWTVDLVQTNLDRLAAAGLLQGPSADSMPAAPARTPRLRLALPASVQLNLVDPSAWLQRHRVLVARMAGRLTLAIAVTLGTCGLFALAADPTTVHTALSTPLSMIAILAVFVGFLFINSLHELGHASLLARYGGRVRRMGFMILYLSPAFFCDVSDGWRLPDRRQRVRVALAGVVVNFGLAGVVGLVSLTLHGEVRTAALVLAVMCYLGTLFNLLPFVKFDGYLALMGAMDIPYLRRKAMADWRSLLARGLFGGRGYGRELPGLSWAPLYGFACAVAPMALVGLVAWNIATSLATWGLVGAIVRLLLAAGLLALLVRSGWQVIALARRAHAHWLRIVAGSLIAAAALSALLMIPINDRVGGGYWVRSDGTVVLTVSGPDDARRIAPGQHVTLQRQGLAVKTAIGAGTVEGADRVATVPLQSVIGFVRTGVHASAHTFVLSSVHLQDQQARAGAAYVRLGRTNVGGWLGRQLLSSPLRTLVG